MTGVGLFGLGASAKDAAIAADIAENTVQVIRDAESMGGYESISEADQFVADAFVFLALARKTTAATVTVDGGNIEASLR